MAQNRSNNGKKITEIKIRTLEELISLNLNTLEQVVTNEIDNKKAALIFTGSRTVTSALKLGVEAMKLGMNKIAGMPTGDAKKLSE